MGCSLDLACRLGLLILPVVLMPGLTLRLTLGLILGLAPPAGASRDNPARLCLDAARIASGQSGVPLRVLLALSLTETGRGRDDDLMPLPWAVNLAGESLWFDTPTAAAAHAGAAIARGEGNVDLGCFQLNWGWHGARFASVEAMLDPVANADYAAALVARHYGRSGDWIAAAGAFHSSTPEVAARYLARFGPIYDSLGEGGPGGAGPNLVVALAGEAPAPAPVLVPVNAFPLLLPGPEAGLGSLVPVLGAAQPLIGSE